MAIKRLKISNFKSFKDLDIELGMFNVLIGANASGKSNFTEIFKFIRNIEENSINDVFSLHGGAPSLRNLKIGRSQNLEIEITSDKKMVWVWDGRPDFQVNETVYRLSIEFGGSDSEVKIKKDELIQKFEIVKEEEKLFEDIATNGQFTLRYEDGKLDVDLVPSNLQEMMEHENILRPYFYFLKSSRQCLLDEKLGMSLIQLVYPFLARPWGTLLGNIGREIGC